jgi:Tfp pilus assembly protein PilF
MPNNTGVLNNLAYVLALNDIRLPDALTLAQKALELSPNNPTMMDTYGFVLYKNRDYERALEYLSAARQQFEQSEEGVPAEIYEHIGMVKEMQGLTQEAMKAYQQALDADAGKLPAAVAERLKDNIGRLSK